MKYDSLEPMSIISQAAPQTVLGGLAPGAEQPGDAPDKGGWASSNEVVLKPYHRAEPERASSERHVLEIKSRFPVPWHWLTQES